MNPKAVLPKVSIVLIDATLFAYASIPLNFFLLYGVLTKFLGHASGNCDFDSYILPNLSLAAIFWAVSFFAFLFPLPSICFLMWNLYRYWFLMDAHTQHLTLIVGYVLATVTAILNRTAWRNFLHFSPGSSVCHVAQLRHSTATAREPISNRIFSTFIASELVEVLRTLLRRPQMPSDNASSKESSATIRIGVASARREMLPIILIALSMIVGLVLSSLWKLPLREFARQIERNGPSAVKPPSGVISVGPACMCWLFAGDGAKAIQLAESQIQKELQSNVPTSETKVNYLVYVIDLADQAGYCDSNHWQQISQMLFGTLSYPFDYQLAYYLQNGDERHGLYSQAAKVDDLRLTAALKTSGQNSTNYIDRLHESALFHARIKDHAQAIKRLTLVIDLCKTNMNSSNASDKNFFTQTVSDSRQKLLSLKQNSAH